MWHFLNGYVILHLEGVSIARLLKRISDQGIRIRRLIRLTGSAVSVQIGVRDFFKLHRLRTGLQVRIRIVEKRGLPFLRLKLQKHPVLWIGTLLMLTAIWFLSQRIWLIRIENGENIDRAELLSLLEEHGLSIGARVKGPVLITAANDLSVRVPNVAWIGLDREGIVLTVSVIESLQESQKRNGSIPSDLVASCDGIVTDICVLHGSSCVKIGDSVRAGDVLISGTVVRNDASYRTWADGTVLAAVRYRAEAELPTEQTEAVLTDLIEPVRSFRIGPWTLLQSKPEFEHYRLTDAQSVAVGYGFPTYCDTRIAQEIVFRKRTLDTSEAEQLALIEAREAALELVPKDASILNIYGTIRTRNGKQTAVVIVTAEENIGRTEEYPNDG